MTLCVVRGWRDAGGEEGKEGEEEVQGPIGGGGSLGGGGSAYRGPVKPEQRKLRQGEQEERAVSGVPRCRLRLL